MPPPRGHFILRSNVLPPVTAGDYELVSEQTGTPFDVDTSRTNITVSSPRYTMPPDQILSSFPPANAEGAFGDRLPQIVLKRRTLPWERNPFGTAERVRDAVAGARRRGRGRGRAVARTAPGRRVRHARAPCCATRRIATSSRGTACRSPRPCVRQDLPLPGGPGAAHPRARGRRRRHRAGQRRRRRVPRRRARQPPARSFDAATGTPVRYQACLVNLEGQLDELPPPSPPEPDFHFELRPGLERPRHGRRGPRRVGRRIGAIEVNLTDVGLDVSDPRRSGRGRGRVSVRRVRGPYGGATLDGATAIGDGQTAASTWTVQATTNATAAVAAAAADPERGLRRARHDEARLPLSDLDLRRRAGALASRCSPTGRSPPTKAPRSRR